jgi:hypothetical protein
MVPSQLPALVVVRVDVVPPAAAFVPCGVLLLSDDRPVGSSSAVAQPPSASTTPINDARTTFRPPRSPFVPDMSAPWGRGVARGEDPSLSIGLTRRFCLPGTGQVDYRVAGNARARQQQARLAAGREAVRPSKAKAETSRKARTTA